MVRTRGNTPQAQAAPVAQMRAKRTTRSQSIEPAAFTSSQTAKPSAARLGGRPPRAGSAESRGSRPRPGADDKPATQDLSIVVEDDVSDDDEPSAEPSTSPVRGLSPSAKRISISGTTARSTESEDDDPERILLEMAPDLCYTAARMLKSLTKTTNIENTLQELNNPASMTAKQLFTLGQNFDRLFSHFGDTFLDPRRIIEDIFKPLNPPPLDSESWALTELVHVANLAYLGNWIANTHAQSTEPEVLDFLEDLDGLPFLSSLLDGPAYGDSELQDETFDFCLAVRTQVAVMKILQQEDGFNPVDILREVFYAPLQSGGFSDQTLRVWNLNGLGSGSTGLRPEFDADIRKRIAEIQYNVEIDLQAIDSGEAQIMQTLASEFSWSKFCVTALQYIYRRTSELDSKIKSRGGSDNILVKVKHDLGVNATILEPEKPSPKQFDSFGSTLAADSAQKMKTIKIDSAFHEKLQQLKKRPSGGHVKQPEIAEQSTAQEIEPTAQDAITQLSRADSASDPNPPQIQEMQPEIGGQTASNLEVTKMRAREEAKDGAATKLGRQETADAEVVDAWAPIEDDEDEAEPSSGPSQTQAPKMLHPRVRSSQEKAERSQRTARFLEKKRQDKENKRSQLTRNPTFIDPQEDAERVLFDEHSQPHQSPPIDSRAVRSKARGKRPAPADDEQDEEVTEDEGFQTDARDIGSRSRRPHVRDGPRPRTDQPPPARRARTSSRTTEASHSRAARVLLPDDELEDDEDVTSTTRCANLPLTNFTQVQYLAQKNVREAKQGTGQRQRKPWTEEETMQLQYLIAEFGTSWAELKRIDDANNKPILSYRDQVALKDKARNMKVDYLTARMDLPRNFEHIHVDKKGRDRLAAQNIPY